MLKSVLRNRELGVNAKKCPYKGLCVERRKANFFEIKCLRSIVGVSPMDRVKNKEVHRRAVIESKSVSRATQRVLRWLGHVARMDVYRRARGC